MIVFFLSIFHCHISVSAEHLFICCSSSCSYTQGIGLLSHNDKNPPTNAVNARGALQGSLASKTSSTQGKNQDSYEHSPFNLRMNLLDIRKCGRVGVVCAALNHASAMPIHIIHTWTLNQTRAVLSLSKKVRNWRRLIMSSYPFEASFSPSSRCLTTAAKRNFRTKPLPNLSSGCGVVVPFRPSSPYPPHHILLSFAFLDFNAVRHISSRQENIHINGENHQNDACAVRSTRSFPRARRRKWRTF